MPNKSIVPNKSSFKKAVDVDNKSKTPAIRRVCNVGYALNQKKLRKSEGIEAVSADGNNSVPLWKGGGLADIIFGFTLNGEPIDDVKFIPFDFNSPEAQPYFDVIIHKLTEELEQSEPSEKIRLIEEYLASHPETVMMDPLAAVEVVTSRRRSCMHLDQISQEFEVGNNKYVLGQPKYFVIDDADDLQPSSFSKRMRLAGLHFPVICKPITACGSPEAHLMAVLVREEDAPVLVRAPCVVQQYHDHGAALLKVYVLGSDVMVYRRTSLPDLGGNCNDPTLEPCYRSSLSTSARSVAFDSRHNYPTLKDFYPRDASDCNDGFSDEKSTISLADVEESLPRECFEQAARIIGAKFSLSLFGFDVILVSPEADICTRDPGSLSSSAQGAPLSLCVVDVNYFPSYKEVHDFPARLRALLRARSEGIPGPHSRSRGIHEPESYSPITSTASVDQSSPLRGIQPSLDEPITVNFELAAR